MYFFDFCLVYEVSFTLASTGRALEERLQRAEITKKLETTTDHDGIRVNFWIPLGRQVEFLMLFLYFSDELNLIAEDYELKCTNISCQGTLHTSMAGQFNDRLQSSMEGITIDEIVSGVQAQGFTDYRTTFEYSVPIFDELDISTD